MVSQSDHKLMKYSLTSGKFIINRAKYCDRMPTVRELVSKNEVPEFFTIDRYVNSCRVSPAFELPNPHPNTILAVVTDFALDKLDHAPGDLIEVHLDEVIQELSADKFDSVTDPDNVCIRGARRDFKKFRDDYINNTHVLKIVTNLHTKAIMELYKQCRDKCGRDLSVEERNYILDAYMKLENINFNEAEQKYIRNEI